MEDPRLVALQAVQLAMDKPFVANTGRTEILPRLMQRTYEHHEQFMEEYDMRRCGLTFERTNPCQPLM